MKIKNQWVDYSKVGGKYILLFTANSVVGKNGLIMGKGNALAAKKTWPELPKLFSKVPHKFGVAFKEVAPQKFIGAFQTKYHWRDPSPIELVKYSVEKLNIIVRAKDSFTFHLPFPAINNGQLKEEDVKILLEVLPDNVIICK